MAKDRNLRIQLLEVDKEYMETYMKKFEEESDEYFKNIIDTEIHQSDS